MELFKFFKQLFTTNPDDPYTDKEWEKNKQEEQSAIDQRNALRLYCGICKRSFKSYAGAQAHKYQKHKK